MVAKVQKPAFKAPVDEAGQPATVDTSGEGWGGTGDLGFTNAGTGDDLGFTTDTASGKAPDDEPPQEGDTGIDADGKASVYRNGEWVLAEEPSHEEQDKVAGAAAEKPKRDRKKVDKAGKDAPAPAPDAKAGTNIATDLIKAVEQIERLNEEADGIASDIKEFYSAAKAKGYSPKIIRKMISRRAMDPDKRVEEDQLLQQYEEAMLAAVDDEPDE